MPAFNQYVLGIAPQTAKGTPATAPTVTTVVRSSAVAPNKETAALEETGQGRDQPAPVVTRISAGGDFELYARPTVMGLLAYGAFGAVADSATGTTWAASTAYTLGDIVIPVDTTANPYRFEVTTAGTTGTTEPAWPAAEGATVTDGSVVFTNRGAIHYNHLSTPADDQPWFTVWRHMFGSSPNRLIERFMDCKLTRFQISGEAGSPAMVITSNMVGLLFERLSDMPAGGELDTSLPVKFVDYDISLDGSPDTAISSFTYNLQAGINTAQTDQLYDSYAEPGGRSLEVNFTKVFTDLSDYNRAIYGGPSGTQPSASEAHASMVASFKDGDGIPRLTLNVGHFKYGTAPLEPNASAGEIGRQEISGAGDIPPDGSDVTTAEVISDFASYTA